MITENNYIDYLTRTDITAADPEGARGEAPQRAASSSSATACATGTCARSSTASGSEEELGWTSWAIRRPLEPVPAELADDPAAIKLHRQRELESELEEAFWNDRGVDIFDVELAALYRRAEAGGARVRRRLGPP